MGSLGAHELANGRTVVRHPHLCVPDNGRIAGGTCGGGYMEVVPRGDGTSSRWRGSASAAQERTTHATEAHEARTDSARTGDHARDGPGLMRPTRARQGLDMEPSRCVRTQSHRQRHAREIVSHPADGLALAGGSPRLPVASDLLEWDRLLRCPRCGGARRGLARTRLRPRRQQRRQRGRITRRAGSRQQLRERS